ncbi:hypothetical protein HHL23_04605 [Chryseobacterium sp. RP-3-3]|uniref:HTH luxR-type domain-containing protein n=1 Tax=Chryseobacterium antibioticum TaxID=2728847 RepID=A0A7Y0AKP2_9FLAO|nr:hypothetical protein [Chryseobacterium antibioticum]NML69071.1 hypothetical protein [Chryseobacterium antibioticum]
MKPFKFLLFLLIPFFSFGQSKSEKENIDRMLAVSDSLYYADQLIPSLKIARQAVKLAKKKKYPKPLAKGNGDISYILQDLGMYKESSHYAEVAEKYVAEDDYEMRAILKNVTGYNYYGLKLYDKALAEFRQEILLYKKIKDKKSIYMTYMDIGDVYEEMKNIDSSNYYYKKGLAGYAKLDQKDKKENYYNFSTTNASIGLNFLKKKNTDSAEFYINQSIAILDFYQDSFRSRPFFLYALSKLTLEKKEYNKALDLSFKAIKIEKKINPKSDIIYLYQNIAGVYAAMHNAEKEKEYLNKSIKMGDSIETEQAKSIAFVINNILNDEKEESKKLQSKTYWIGGIIFILILLLVSIGYINSQKHENKKEAELLEKDQILLLKEKETRQLEKKLNASFEETVQLAKENNPEFLTRFIEIYPEFINKLQQISPKLQASELKLCALLFLNFSSKDIAKFTFTSSRTVQNRKYNLRKKLNIPSDLDINIWMNTIVNGD